MILQKLYTVGIKTIGLFTTSTCPSPLRQYKCRSGEAIQDIKGSAESEDVTEGERPEISDGKPFAMVGKPCDALLNRLGSLILAFGVKSVSVVSQSTWLWCGLQARPGVNLSYSYRRSYSSRRRSFPWQAVYRANRLCICTWTNP